MSPSVAKLAANLEQAEANGEPLREHKRAYLAAVRAPWIAKYESLHDANPPTKKRLNSALRERAKAREALDAVDNDPSATIRRMIDAAAEVEVTEGTFDILRNIYARHQVQQRAQHKADVAAGIVRE